jgi:hypothetical protein
MRLIDWTERFAEFLESRRHMPFAWGSNDCALFAADNVLNLTGIDYAEGLRSYDDAQGAATLISKAGGLASFAKYLPQKPVGLAQRGDIVLALCDGRETFGVVMPDNKWVAPGPDGLVFRDMTEALRVFAV